MTYRLVLISHGNYAEGLKHALEMIIGKQEFIEAHGLPEGGSPNDIVKELSGTFEENETVVILSDIIGGSMHNAAVPLVNNENVFLVGGVNLALAIQVALMKPATAEEIDEQLAEAKQAFQRIVIETTVDDEDDFFS